MLALLAVLVGSSAGTALAQTRADPQAQGSDFYVVNTGPTAIEQVYVSATGDRNWGRDRLSRTLIEKGDSFLIRGTLPGGCQGDVRVVYEGGAQVERRNQNLCRINRMDFSTPARSSRRSTGQLSVSNESDQPIESLYITRAGDRDWGQNLLPGSERIDRKERRQVRLESSLGCQVDVRADFPGGDKVEFYNENICNQTVVAFFAPERDAAGGSGRFSQGGPQPGDPGQRERERGGPPNGGTPDPAGRDPAGRDPRSRDPRAARDGGNGNLTFLNDYRVGLRELYVSPSKVEGWGRDFLPDRVVVAPRDRYSVQVDTSSECVFDIKAVWTSDAQQELRRQNLCVARSVVLTGPPPGEKLWSGTGFYVSRNGHVLTNRHVIDGCARVEITRPNRPGTPLLVIGDDEPNDLALLQEPNTQVRPVVFRSPARPLRNGEPSIALGYPIRELLGSLIVTSGIVSSLTGSQGNPSRLQMQTPIQPGNSGGPVFDDTGQLIGVSVARIERVGGRNIQNVNFAVKGDIARKFIESHNVQVDQAPPGPKLTPADITEQQEGRVLALVCYN